MARGRALVIGEMASTTMAAKRFWSGFALSPSAERTSDSLLRSRQQQLGADVAATGALGSHPFFDVRSSWWTERRRGRRDRNLADFDDEGRAGRWLEVRGAPRRFCQLFLLFGLPRMD